MAAIFRDRRPKDKCASDVHVYKGDGQRHDTDPAFFGSNIESATLAYEVPITGDRCEWGWGLRLEFSSGGALLLSQHADPVWIEPERH